MAAREGRLRRRPSSKAASIRRGKLRISSPMPVTGADKDMAFPGQPLSPLAHQRQTQESLLISEEAGDVQHIDNDQTKDSSNLRHKRSARKVRELSQADLTSTSLGAEQGSRTSAPNTLQMADNSKRKSRGTSLRMVIRKMFGSKGKPESKDVSTVESGHDITVSQVVTIDRPTTRPDWSQNPPPSGSGTAGRSGENMPYATRDRAASLPAAKEFDSSRSLGSHLPFPMNVNAPAESGRERGQPLTFDIPVQPQHRRKSWSSVGLGSPEAAMLSSAWRASYNRATPTDDQDLRLPIADSEIGVAVTSGSSQNRRSRSAGALHDLATNKAGLAMATSMTDEIRRWRESYPIHTTALSGSQNPPDVAVEDESDDSPPPAVEMIPQPKNESYVGGEQRAHGATAPAEERLPSGDARSPDHALVDRVIRLEQEVQALERSVQKLIGRANRQTIILQEVPQDFDSDRPREFVAEKTSNVPSYVSMTPSPAPPFVPPPSPIPQHMHQHSHRPTHSRASSVRADTTVRYSNTAPSHSPTSPDAVSALYLLLSHERTSRKNLEMYMQGLQRELLEMRGMMMTGPSTTPQAYPAHLAPFTELRPDLRQHGDDRRQTSRFSQFDSGDDEDDGETGGASARHSAGPLHDVAAYGAGPDVVTSHPSGMSISGDMESEEIYETPLEEPYGRGWTGVGEPHGRHVGMV